MNKVLTSKLGTVHISRDTVQVTNNTFIEEEGGSCSDPRAAGETVLKFVLNFNKWSIMKKPNLGTVTDNIKILLTVQTFTP